MQSVSPRDHPCPDGGIGRRAGLKIQCPLKTCGFEPRSGHEKGSPRGSLSRALFGRMSRPGHPPRYPLPKSLPSGEGLGGRSRRSPAGSVASLRKCFDSRSIQHQMGPYTHAAEASFSSIQFPLPPAIFQGTVSEGVTKRVTARGILTRAPCQFRLYKCLILKRFLSP